MTRWAAMRNLLIYVILSGVVPMLVMATALFVGFFLDAHVLRYGALMTFIMTVSAILAGLATSLRLQEWFEKKFS